MTQRIFARRTDNLNLFPPPATLQARSAAAYGRVIGANERIGVGFIGYGLIGKRHVLDFQVQSDVRMAAVAEVHRGRLEEARALIGGSRLRPRPFGQIRVD